MEKMEKMNSFFSKKNVVPIEPEFEKTCSKCHKVFFSDKKHTRFCGSRKERTGCAYKRLLTTSRNSRRRRAKAKEAVARASKPNIIRDMGNMIEVKADTVARLVKVDTVMKKVKEIVNLYDTGVITGTEAKTIIKTRLEA